ncbi:hypothetical protein [Prevotella sp.]|uniref:hypothetical protein n=1 Tax=Prevotella sp. TaxID=59823 RepID=UPI002601069A|nr:hypothetical protein [Prevotella sp.]
MRTILRNIALCAFSLCSIATYAQQDRNVVFHMSDKTTKTVSLVGVDSLTFEKAVRTPLNLDLEIHSTYIKQIMTCSDPNMRYYVSYLEKEVFDAEYPTDEALVADDKQWMEDMAKSYGMSVSEMVSQFTYTGNFDEYQANLLPGHEYVVWMHGMDEQANSTTPVTKIAFRAKDVDRIANTVTLTAEKTAEGIKVTASPDDKTKNYTLGFFPTSMMRDEMTGMPQGTRDYMQTGISSSLYDYLANNEMPLFFENNAFKGDANITYTNPSRNTEYYIVAAYLDDEAAICSDISQITVNRDGSLSDVTMVKAPAKFLGKTVRRHAK